MSVVTRYPLYVGADQSVTLTGMRDEDGNYLNTGTATWELVDEDGESLGSGTLTYVAASNGNYRGVIDGPTVTSLCIVGEPYEIEMTFVQGAFDDFRRLPMIGTYRGQT